MSLGLEKLRVRQKLPTITTKTIGQKEMMELLGPRMDQPTELSENELRLVMAMITMEPSAISIDGLLKLGLRHGFMVELAECDETKLKELLQKKDRTVSPSPPPPESRAASKKSKKKGRASKAKANATTTEHTETELPETLTIDTGDVTSVKQFIGPDGKRQFPPIRFSAAFIRHIRQPEVRKRLIAIGDVIWEASCAFWDWEKARGQRQTAALLAEKAGLPEPMAQIAEAAHRAGEEAGIRMGIQAAIRDHHAAQGTTSDPYARAASEAWAVDTLQVHQLKEESPLRTRAAVIRAGSSLARPCSSLFVPLPEDAGPTLTMHRKKVLYGETVREIRGFLEQLLAHGKIGEKSREGPLKAGKSSDDKSAPAGSVGGPSGPRQGVPAASGGKTSDPTLTRERGAHIASQLRELRALADGAPSGQAADRSGREGDRVNSRLFESTKRGTRSRSCERATEDRVPRPLEVPRLASSSTRRPTGQDGSQSGSGSGSGPGSVFVGPRTTPVSAGGGRLTPFGAEGRAGRERGQAPGSAVAGLLGLRGRGLRELLD